MHPKLEVNVCQPFYDVTNGGDYSGMTAAHLKIRYKIYLYI